MTESPKKASLLAAVRNGFEKLLGGIVAVLFAGMVLLVFGNVIARYFLSAAIGWSEEVSRFMLIWITFLGSVLAFMRSEHLGLDLLVKYMPAYISKTIVILADLLVLGALAYMINGGIDMTKDSLASGWVSSAVPIPYGYVYMIVPITSSLMFIECLVKIVSDIIKSPSQIRNGGEVC